MPIPTAFDHSLVEIDAAAGSVMIQLRTMQHAAPNDLPLMRRKLREKMQAYVDAVFALADEVAG